MREISHTSPTSSSPPHPRAPDRPPPITPARYEPFIEPETRHLHRIAVETGPQPVFVTIGQQEKGAPDSSSEGAQGSSSAHAVVPGGFAKLFNRVIDSGAWAGLPEAARAIYPPLVRFADGRDGFRVRIGLAALMRYTGLSRSSVKRGLRGLLEARLIAIVRAGGVAPDGTNRTNVYQLLVPELDGAGDEPSRPAPCLQSALSEQPRPKVQSAARAKRGRATAPQAHLQHPSQSDGLGVAASFPERNCAGAAASVRPEMPQTASLVFSVNSWCEHLHIPGPFADPLPAQDRSPAPRAAEPRVALAAVPVLGRRPNPVAGLPAARTRPGIDPLHRSFLSEETTEHAAAFDEAAEDVHVSRARSAGNESGNSWFMSEDSSPAPQADPALARQLRELLCSWGVESAIAAQLARDHSPAAIHAAVDLARQAKARRRLRNPGGFIVRCLEESWAPAEQGAALSRPPARDDQHQAVRRAEEERALAARQAADDRIDTMDDETLGLLANRVLQMHADRPAMLRLLEARPPRESRLMRAEISSLLQA